MEYLRDFFELSVHNETLAVVLSMATVLLIIYIATKFVDIIVTKRLASLLRNRLGEGNSTLFRSFSKHNIFQKTRKLAPLLFAYAAIMYLNISFEDDIWTIILVKVIEFVLSIYALIIISKLLTSLVDCLFDYLKGLPFLKGHSLTSYSQLIKILIYIIIFMLIVSVIVQKSPFVFLTGLGALSAVLILIFRDTILGFSTNVQVAALDLVRVGDCISIPSLDAEGTVIDISINVVKIMNFDKTISTIPSYSLITNNVRNWRGMLDSGGRRIMRTINIDKDTIKFCDNELITKLSTLEYIPEILSKNSSKQITNITIFRAYVEQYAKNHPQILNNDEYNVLVRGLDSTSKGLPIQLYMFSNETNWVDFEAVQSDLTDYILASLEFFDLRAYQDVTGNLADN